MTRRNAAAVDRVLKLLGTDLALDYPGPSGYWEDADLAIAPPTGRLPPSVDLGVASRLAAADQLLVNRLKTHKGELEPLGHPGYGSRHHDLIGYPNTESTRNLIKLHVLEALSHEPRIEKVLACKVRAAHTPPRDTVRIEISVRLWGEPQPLNFVVPFNLEVGANP
jgi:phage baseplate assembly protein W